MTGLSVVLLSAERAQNRARLAAEHYILPRLTQRPIGARQQAVCIPDHLLTTRVKVIYHTGNTKYHKPDPRVFDELFVSHQFEPSECIYIGDSLTDAQATKGAGMKFIATLESGLHQKSDFDEYNVDAFVDKFPDIVDKILSF
jgi:FMN phosphatase YigB (HAD superfamily)